jgi:peroxiredoxin
LGANLLLISPQTKTYSQKVKDEKGLTMEILSDPGNSVGEKFGLIYTFTEELKQAYLQLGIDLKEYNSADVWRLPLVARYIIDKSGIIQYAIVSADHTDRVEPEHTLKALEALEKQQAES